MLNILLVSFFDYTVFLELGTEKKIVKRCDRYCGNVLGLLCHAVKQIGSRG